MLLFDADFRRNGRFDLLIKHTIMTKLILTLFLLSTTLTAISQEKSKPQPAFDFLAKFPNVRDLAMTSDQSEAYFTIQSPNEEIGVIAFAKKVKGKWSKPALTSFASEYRDIEPFLTADGLKLYFASNRPLNDLSTKEKDYDIWYVERKTLTSAWSAPINLGQPINTPNNEFYPSLATNGNLYFTSDGNAALNKDDIYWSAWDGKAYAAPQAMDENINSVGYEFNAYIAPNESFIIYTAYNRKDGLGSGDLYISRKDATTNTWGKATNMGAPINSTAMDYCPFLDLKTNVLYFTSKRNSVSPQKFKSIEDFEKVAGQYENGWSRLYRVEWK